MATKKFRRIGSRCSPGWCTWISTAPQKSRHTPWDRRPQRQYQTNARRRRAQSGANTSARQQRLRAISTVDHCIGCLSNDVGRQDGTLLITAENGISN
ncbi:MAG TPA: hypothetical protein DD687_16140 [Verrucomicrobiales bacterium]|nr:hypothetical protein [Verrucomicrobiales bacterium]HBP57459.1 hypothetical protein [Verrucomicrobiales bacterium]